MDGVEFRRNLSHALSHAGPLPKRVAFVAHTGQWLKPVLQQLFQHHAANVEVYVRDPGIPARHPDGTVHVADLLSILEFFWTLPTDLALQNAKQGARLTIYTYDASEHYERMAYFEGTLSPGASNGAGMTVHA